MIATSPPHYRAFRAVLAACVLLALLAMAWYLVQPDALRVLFRFLGLRVA